MSCNNVTHGQPIPLLYYPHDRLPFVRLCQKRCAPSHHSSSMLFVATARTLICPFIFDPITAHHIRDACRHHEPVGTRPVWHAEASRPKQNSTSIPVVSPSSFGESRNVQQKNIAETAAPKTGQVMRYASVFLPRTARGNAVQANRPSSRQKWAVGSCILDVQDS